MAVGDLCLVLAARALSEYEIVNARHDAAIKMLITQRLASRIQTGIEDDLEDLVRDGKIVKKEALCSEASSAPAPAAGTRSGANSGEAGAATTPNPHQEILDWAERKLSKVIGR